MPPFHRLCALLPGPLLLGNSLPARLLDMLGQPRPADDQPGRVFSNRGASGIDGLIASLSAKNKSLEAGKVAGK